MSSTSSIASTTTAASASASCTPDYVIPVSDAACAVQNIGNASQVLSTCCGEATVTSYNSGCTEYCLAQGQNITDLVDCLYSNNVDWSNVFCNAAGNATATAAVSSASSTASGTSTGTSTASSSGSSSSSTSKSNSGVKMTTSGVGVLALVFCSALFGAFA